MYHCLRRAALAAHTHGLRYMTKIQVGFVRRLANKPNDRTPTTKRGRPAVIQCGQKGGTRWCLRFEPKNCKTLAIFLFKMHWTYSFPVRFDLHNCPLWLIISFWKICLELWTYSFFKLFGNRSALCLPDPGLASFANGCARHERRSAGTGQCLQRTRSDTVRPRCGQTTKTLHTRRRFRWCSTTIRDIHLAEQKAFLNFHRHFYRMQSDFPGGLFGIPGSSRRRKKMWLSSKKFSCNYASAVR